MDIISFLLSIPQRHSLSLPLYFPPILSILPISISLPLTFSSTFSFFSDKAISEKITARNISGDTAPFVRHLLFRTAAEAMMSGRPLHQLSVGLWSSEMKDSSDDDVRTRLQSNNSESSCYV